jgi:hypothetical protein
MIEGSRAREVFELRAVTEELPDAPEAGTAYSGESVRDAA